MQSNYNCNTNEYNNYFVSESHTHSVKRMNSYRSIVKWSAQLQLTQLLHNSCRLIGIVLYCRLFKRLTLL